MDLGFEQLYICILKQTKGGPPTPQSIQPAAIQSVAGASPPDDYGIYWELRGIIDHAVGGEGIYL